MSNPQVIGTTPLSAVSARVGVATAVIICAYYRLALPFFILSLYLLYLLWSYYWTWRSCRFVAVESHGQETGVFAGETYSQKYTFTNDWFLPLVRFGINFQLPTEFDCSGDVVKLQGKKLQNEELTISVDYISPSWERYTASYSWLGEGKSVTVVVTVTPQLRGVYFLPPMSFFAGDPSGLFQGTKRVGKEQLFYVFPQLNNQEALERVLAFEEEGRKDIFGLEDRYQFQGVRDYQPGDALKNINWYASARTGSLRTNLYERKDSANCLVVLDLTMPEQSSYLGNAQRVKDPAFESALSIVVGAALYHLEQGISTAFFSNAPQLQWVRKEGSKKYWMKRMRQITTLDFAMGDEQAQNILKFCASIDENGRAYAQTQDDLWSIIRDSATDTIIYIFCYHSPPDGWQQTVKQRTDVKHSLFYTSAKLKELAASKVKVINLSEVTDK